jgi:hypothetical protein
MSEQKPLEEPKAPEPKKDEEPSKLMLEAQRAYGIRDQHVLASKEYKDHVVIVTRGGSKVSFAPGDVVKKLDDAQLHGQPKPKPKK